MKQNMKILLRFPETKRIGVNHQRDSNDTDQNNDPYKCSADPDKCSADPDTIFDFSDFLERISNSNCTSAQGLVCNEIRQLFCGRKF